MQIESQRSDLMRREVTEFGWSVQSKTDGGAMIYRLIFGASFAKSKKLNFGVAKVRRCKKNGVEVSDDEVLEAVHRRA